MEEYKSLYPPAQPEIATPPPFTSGILHLFLWVAFILPCVVFGTPLFISNDSVNEAQIYFIPF